MHFLSFFSIFIYLFIILFKDILELFKKKKIYIYIYIYYGYFENNSEWGNNILLFLIFYVGWDYHVGGKIRHRGGFSSTHVKNVAK